MPCLCAAALCSFIRSVPGNGTAVLKPSNVQLWGELLGINKPTFRLMHSEKDIRANYDVCVSGQKVIAGSVAVIHVFHCNFGIGKWM